MFELLIGGMLHVTTATAAEAVAELDKYKAPVSVAVTVPDGRHYEGSVRDVKYDLRHDFGC